MSSSTAAAEELPETWDEFRLDGKLVEAIRSQKWSKPTTVQRACLAKILRGHDVSIQSRTGSGKTAAFAIPVVQMLLNERNRLAATKGKKKASAAAPSGEMGFTSLVLVPSVELSEQTAETLQALSKYIKPRLVIRNLSDANGANAAVAGSAADVVISTPAALAKLLKAGTLNASALQTIKMLVIDEADLLLSIASSSLRIVQSMLPATKQTVLLSATLTEGVAAIKGQLLRNPYNIKLTNDDDEEQQKPGTKRKRRADADLEDEEDPIVEKRVTIREETQNLLKQTYLVATDQCHKHTLLYALYRMNVISGKTLIFVDDEQDTYRLQHFLEQLSVASIVYNANLPMNVRLDMLRRFQHGDVATMICTDGTLEMAERANMQMEGSSRRARKMAETAEDEASALHRGIDFNQVRNVILFDGIGEASAINLSRYSHRIGRTGRAGNAGTSILLLSLPQAQNVLTPMRDALREKNEKLRPLKKMDRAKATSLQYRVDGVLQKVTRTSTRKLRVATVASELARSSYLSTHLSSKDNEVLKNIVKRSQSSVKVDNNMLHVPDYMKMGKKVDDVKHYKKRVNSSDDSRKQNAFATVLKPKRVDPLQNAVANAKKATKEAIIEKKRAERKAKQ